MDTETCCDMTNPDHAGDFTLLSSGQDGDHYWEHYECDHCGKVYDQDGKLLHQSEN